MFFKEQIKKRIKNEKGLTLIELLAVIVILAIIAAIAIPSIGNIIANSRSKAVISDAQNVMTAAQLYFVDNPDSLRFVSSDVTGATTAEIATFKEFVESPGGLTKITVTKANPNTIGFTADVNGTTSTIGPVTLDDLNKAKVAKGVITINVDTTETTFPTPTGD